VIGAMVAAEVLKLRRRRGLLVLAVALTVGAVVLVLGVLAFGHAADPGTFAAAGGGSGWRAAGDVLSALGLLAAVMVGATAGAGDHAAGVFRDLVATGRSRLTLFAVRLPGALLVVGALVVAALAVAALAATLLPATEARPGAGTVLRQFGAQLLVTSAFTALAVGTAAVFGSRGIALGAMFAWLLIIENILLALEALGVLRRLLLTNALTRLAEGDGGSGVVSISRTAAVAVVVGWVALALGLGAWRTARRDV
jgi:hypothetical protein